MSLLHYLVLCYNVWVILFCGFITFFGLFLQVVGLLYFVGLFLQVVGLLHFEHVFLLECVYVASISIDQNRRYYPSRWYTPQLCSGLTGLVIQMLAGWNPANVSLFLELSTQ